MSKQKLENEKNSIDLRKVMKNYDKIKGNKKITPIILVSGGSYNPVHKMHIHSYNLAKKALESENKQVIGGFLVPTSNNYVYGKLYNDAIELKHRVEMIKLSTENSDFIGVCPWGYVSGFSAGYRIAEILKGYYPELRDRLQIYFVVGADFAFRCGLWGLNERIFVIARGEETNLLRESMKKDRRSEDESFMIFESEECFDFSSTKVREQMEKGEFDKEMLDEKVIEYLKQNKGKMNINY